MEYIAHRINTVSELQKLPEEYGVELDLRDSGQKIILQHEPFTDGESFEEYLKEYHHGMMILNVKSERIEYKVLELIKQYGVEDYFFLDSSFPMINTLSLGNEKKCALRFSEYEGLDTIYNMKGKCDWVWVDCFTKLPITKKIESELKSIGYKLCLVSPELQGRQDDIAEYKEYLKNENIDFDAICTKQHNIDLWMNG